MEVGQVVVELPRKSASQAGEWVKLIEVKLVSCNGRPEKLQKKMADL